MQGIFMLLEGYKAGNFGLVEEVYFYTVSYGYNV